MEAKPLMRLGLEFKMVQDLIHNAISESVQIALWELGKQPSMH